ncbi:MAG: sulfatase [Actinomycetia bacterium]|nr:sulfatase [Actinomycetes bacterium]
MTDGKAVVNDAHRPRNLVVVLLDSLNRHMLAAYGDPTFATPHLDRFAAESVRFDRHYVGSLPCMPARHDLLVGSLDFLWRPWGSIEVWEEAITYELRRAGVVTALVSDHPHLFETGGENYHTDFHTWEYLRGSENDPWRLIPDPTAVGTPDIPAARPAPFPRAYDTARSWFRAEPDFPGPRTMAAAADWVRHHADLDDRFLLFIDEFDPHEPFDTPEPWASMYDPGWEGPKLIWPLYSRNGVGGGHLTEAEGRQLRASYGAGLSMIDAWFGHLLEVLDATGRADDTAVVVCTDHGHYLGDTDPEGRDLWGKPAAPLYEPLAHTPLFVRWPGRPAGVYDELTTNVDIHATIADLFDVEVGHRTHGRSLIPALEGKPEPARPWVLAGYWGQWVNIITGDRRKYARSFVGDHNGPLSMWSNRWSTMPLPIDHSYRIPRPDRRATLEFMPGSDNPVIRQPFEPGDELPYWARGTGGNDHHLFHLGDDPHEIENRAGDDARSEAEMAEQLRVALLELEAPADQLERLGLA